MAGWVAGSNGNNANSASVEVEAELGKKIGSNVDNLRNLEPQPEQTFLIKKNKCTAFAIFQMCFKCVSKVLRVRVFSRVILFS